MQATRTINRLNLNEAVATAVRELILDGRLIAGERINEVHLAAQLGVSRTPLREALIRLVAEGAVSSRPRCGFYVCPLTVEELEQIYPIRALLDPEALRLAGLPSPERLARLEALNRQLREAVEPEDILKLDDAWHLELLDDCPNRVLLGLIEQFIRRTRRYELALMREKRNILRAVLDHDAILAALRAGDLAGACAALRHNMESGKAPIVAWLRERQANPPRGAP
jgi:DNA-binding GntR family transcriptional regulator